MFAFLAVIALVAVLAGVSTIVGMRRDRARRLRIKRRYEQPATLEAGGSHLSADRRR